VSSLADRMRFPAEGYKGGKPGAPGAFRTSIGTRPNPKLSISLPAGTTFTLQLPGGGGFYNPATRDPEAVARDVAEGLVSPAAALREYGVRVTRSGRITGLERSRGAKRGKADRKAGKRNGS
jgi:N-methylhydantoinase B